MAIEIMHLLTNAGFEDMRTHWIILVVFSITEVIFYFMRMGSQFNLEAVIVEELVQLRLTTSFWVRLTLYARYLPLAVSS